MNEKTYKYTREEYASLLKNMTIPESRYEVESDGIFCYNNKNDHYVKIGRDLERNGIVINASFNTKHDKNQSMYDNYISGNGFIVYGIVEDVLYYAKYSNGKTLGLFKLSSPGKDSNGDFAASYDAEGTGFIIFE